jgi:glycosyltransferase involved in cell wall biosynthesis
MRMAGLFWYEHILKAPEWKARYETLFNSVDAVNFLHPALADLVYEKMQELEMSVKFKGNFCGDIGSCLPVGRSLRYECLSEHPFQIVMVARFTDIQKRQDILVQGVAKIPKNIQIHLTLIGNGIRKPFIKELVNKLGIEDCVSFFDFMPQEKLWSILMRSSLLCNCSDFEGVSKIVLESMAIGLPVLCSDVLPNNSYITEGYNGFLVENNPEAWAEKLCLLVDDRSVRQRVSSEAMRYISRKYDPYRNITLYEHAFKSI